MFGALSPGARLAALLALALSYATISIRTQPPGLTRLLMSLPVVLLFTMGPLQMEESLIIKGSLGFMLAWLCNFKLIAYSANRGPLAHPGLGAAQWLLLLLLPYFPAKRGHTRVRAGSVVLSLLGKIALVAVLTLLLVAPQGFEYPSLRHAGYALYVWLFASLLLDAPMPLGFHLLGHLDLQPAMVNPFASTSVREFWGRRYNQIVSAILKDTIYQPIMEGRWMAPSSTSTAAAAQNGSTGAAPKPVYDTADGGADPAQAPETGGVANGGVRRRRTAAVGASEAVAAGPEEGPQTGSSRGPSGLPASELRQVVAMFAAFAVSGIMHEACIMYMCENRLEGSFRMLSFFLVQPLVILAQDAATAALVPKSMRDSRAVALVQTGMTLALVVGSADVLFWGPFEACKIDQRGLAEAMGAMQWLRSWGEKLAAGLGGRA